MNMLKQKLRAPLACIIRTKLFLTTEAKLITYNSLLLSHLRYCIGNWCFGNTTIINQLQRICNKFIRAIDRIKRKSSVKNIMIENKLLTIRQLYNTEIAIVMYQYKKNYLPEALQNLFQIKTSQIKTRSSSQIVSSFLGQL